VTPFAPDGSQHQPAAIVVDCAWADHHNVLSKPLVFGGIATIWTAAFVGCASAHRVKIAHRPQNQPLAQLGGGNRGDGTQDA
jgi:hypothetical protein